MTGLNLRLRQWNKQELPISDERFDQLMTWSYMDGRHDFAVEMILEGVRRLVAMEVGCPIEEVEVMFASECDPV